MIRLIGKRLVVGGLLAAGALIVSGCEKKPTRPAIDPAVIAGEWVQIVEESEANPRVMKRAEGALVRHITINQDGTYVMTLHKKSGEQTKHKFEGTWVLEDENRVMTFTVTSSTFQGKDERQDWAPETSDGPSKRDVSGVGLTEVLPVYDLEGMLVDYKRK